MATSNCKQSSMDGDGGRPLQWRCREGTPCLGGGACSTVDYVGEVSNKCLIQCPPDEVEFVLYDCCCYVTTYWVGRVLMYVSVVGQCSTYTFDSNQASLMTGLEHGLELWNGLWNGQGIFVYSG